MPVSVVCDAASVVNAALHESLVNVHGGSNSSSTSNNTTNCSIGRNKSIINKNDDDDDDYDNNNDLQNKLIASTKRVLLTKIEYEEVNNYNQSVLDTLKSKYIILKPSSSSQQLNGYNSGNGKIPQPNGNNSNSSTGSGGGNIGGGGDKKTTAIQNNANSGHPQNGSKLSDPNQLPQPKRILFPKENVQIGWRNSQRKWQIGAGMINVGNTCYLNSTLQALFHVPAMANWLISDSQHREKCEDENGVQGGCIICAMSKTLIASQTNQSAIRPYLVYTKLKSVCKHLIMGRQEDAHEFLRYLVEAMEKSYLSRYRNWKELDQHSKETTPLNQILGGYLKSAVRCLACGHVSTTFQHFQDLLLDIRKANTIEEALDGYFARERLEDMGYKCEACKKKVSATKQFSLERAPISLCIQLKRFSMMGTKLNKQVAIRPRLDLRPYASKKNNGGEPLVYRLVSMVTHLGASQHCGHYTAIGVTDSGGYYQFDDSCVRPISIQSVLNTNAYIIFYELEDAQHQQHQQSTCSSTTVGKLTSTQISGEHQNNGLEQQTNKENLYNHNHKMNGQLNHHDKIESIFQKQQNNSSLISSTSVTNNSSNKIDTKMVSTTTTATMIGPQLPSDKSLLNGYKTIDNNSTKTSLKLNQNQNGSSTFANSDKNINNLPYYKLVNASSKLVKSPQNNSTNNNDVSMTSISSLLSPKQKLNNQHTTSLNNKLSIHFKNQNNGNTTTNNNGGNVKFGENNNLLKGRIFDSNKITENCIIQTKKIENQSTPKHEHIQQQKNCNSSSSLGVVLRSPDKTTMNSSSSSNGANKSSTATSNKLICSPIVSLVPYETDDESNNDDDNNDTNTGCNDNKKNNSSSNNSNNNKNNNNSISNKNEKHNSKRNFIVLDENSSSSSSSSSLLSLSIAAGNTTDLLKSKTPPSPPVVKSKTGLWQVTKANIPDTTNTTNNNPTTMVNCIEKKNPFASSNTFSSTGISPSKFYSSSSSNKMTINGKDKKTTTENRNVNNATVNQLMKFSHRGYGGPVLNWNGQRTDMEKEINEEDRLERKRELKDDEENEIDRGRQKKIKIHNNNNNNNNNGYNPFQEYQNNNNSNNKQQNQRRWNNSNNNKNNGRPYNQGISYNRHNNSNNPFYHRNRNYSNNNNNNNNFRNHRNSTNNHHRFNKQRITHNNKW